MPGDKGSTTGAAARAVRGRCSTPATTATVPINPARSTARLVNVARVGLVIDGSSGMSPSLPRELLPPPVTKKLPGYAASSQTTSTPADAPAPPG
jgi:hypothetical protein